jgi:hypothetical protein
VAPDLQNRWHWFWAVCIFRCASASPKIPDFPETLGKSPEYPGFTNKIVLSGDFQNSPIHPPLGDIKIFQDHLKFLKHMQRLKLLSILPTLCRNYRGVRYFWYMVGTIDMAEEVKTKF